MKKQKIIIIRYQLKKDPKIFESLKIFMYIV